MSTQNRSAGSRSKASKTKTTQNEAPASTPAQETNAKEKKVSGDSVKPEKEKVQIKPTAEQIRIAQITDIKGGIEDPKIREKVLNLMEMTERSEEDVCCALYECDNDLDRAVIFLLEQLPVGAFATTSKKKKNKTKDEANAGETEWNNENTAPNSTEAREKGRNRGGGGGPVSNGDRNKGGRPREKKREDRNGTSDFKVDTFRSGPDRDKGKLSKSNVPGGNRGARGGGRGGPGQGRSNYRENRSRNVEHQEIDSWDASQGIVTEKQKEVPIDTWGDWDNEEYKTLADSKVFNAGSTMSAATAIGNQPELAAPPGLEQQILNAPAQQIDSYSSAISANTNATSTSQQPQYSDLHSGTSAAAQLRQALELPQIQSTTLSAEQSQYFNTLSSQNSGAQFNSTFPSNQYNVSEHATQRSRRSRVPPPSKIPSSAVEMPGDNLSNIGYLDVQFGGLDFGTDDSFDAVNDKFRDPTLEPPQTLNTSDVSEYQSNKASQSSSLASAGLQATQLLANADNISAHNDSISTRSVNNGSAGSNAAFSLNKPESYNISQSNTAGYQAGGTFASNAKITSYQQTVHNTYGSSSYPNAQGTNYTPASSNTYNSFNPSAAGSFPQSGSVAVSSVGSVPNNGNQNNANANQTHGNSQNVNSNSSYLSNQYSVNPTSSTSYASPQNPYQSNQTFGTSGLSSNSGFPTSTNTSSSTFNSFSTSKIKDNTSVSTTFDSSNVATSTSTSNSTSVNLSSPSLGLSSSKSINSTAKSGSATMVPNIPMVSQYIQTPGGMPFYQPQIYSFEDLQMVQPRVSHVPGYFDLNYQTPTSLGAAGVREGSLGSVAYSAMSDARFTRTDNNSSPVSNVPSTISQQTGSGGPMLNLPYAYFYSSNAMMPGGFQYGAPAIYPQQMATANATSGGQFPKPSYNSNYGSSSYDNLTQGNQEYGKTSYAGSGVGQNKAQTASNPQGVGSSGSDMSSSMYGKSHAGLSKVNSYENKSFHSGTPPPFNLVGSQTALNSASAQPYGSQHLYIPTMPAPHHNIGMHQPHQDSSRQQPSNQGKGTKQGYSPSYWAAQS